MFAGVVNVFRNFAYVKNERPHCPLQYWWLSIKFPQNTNWKEDKKPIPNQNK